ncbi:hypothetical protein EIP86_004461 [Pleurotus ostreatoroseus]|nr:hypothetical protein EIP86_004461 [Pleurotus ostreatoroseus]
MSYRPAASHTLGDPSYSPCTPLVPEKKKAALPRRVPNSPVHRAGNGRPGLGQTASRRLLVRFAQLSLFRRSHRRVPSPSPHRLARLSLVIPPPPSRGCESLRVLALLSFGFTFAHAVYDRARLAVSTAPLSAQATGSPAPAASSASDQPGSSPTPVASSNPVSSAPASNSPPASTAAASDAPTAAAQTTPTSLPPTATPTSPLSGTDSGSATVSTGDNVRSSDSGMVWEHAATNVGPFVGPVIRAVIRAFFGAVVESVIWSVLGAYVRTNIGAYIRAVLGAFLRTFIEPIFEPTVERELKPDLAVPLKSNIESAVLGPAVERVLRVGVEPLVGQQRLKVVVLGPWGGRQYVARFVEYECERGREHQCEYELERGDARAGEHGGEYCEYEFECGGPVGGGGRVEHDPCVRRAFLSSAGASWLTSHYASPPLSLSLPPSISPHSVTVQSISVVTTTNSLGQPTTSTPFLITTVITTTDGGGSTVVKTIVAHPTTLSPDTSHGGSQFFSNKGAVTGVFLVAGLAAAAIAIFLFFFIRRRRRTRRLELDRAMNSALAAHGLTRTPLDGDDYQDDVGEGSARASGSALGSARGSGSMAQRQHSGSFGMATMSSLPSGAGRPPSAYLDDPSAPGPLAGPSSGPGAGAHDFDPYAAYGTVHPPPAAAAGLGLFGSRAREGYVPARTSSPPPGVGMGMGHSHSHTASSGSVGAMLGAHAARESAGSFEPLIAAAGLGGGGGSVPPTPTPATPVTPFMPPAVPPRSPRRPPADADGGSREGERERGDGEVGEGDEGGDGDGDGPRPRDSASSVYSEDDQLVDLLPRPLEVRNLPEGQRAGGDVSREPSRR